MHSRGARNHGVSRSAFYMRASSRGKDTGFPSRKRGFESRRPLQIQNEKRKTNMGNMLWIALSGIQLIALVGLVACLPGLYRREAAKERRA